MSDNVTGSHDSGPQRADAVRGALRDSGLAAVLGAVAGHRPESIRRLIHERDDGDYEVRLHQTRVTRHGAEPTGRRLHVVVTPLSVHAQGTSATILSADYRAPGVTWPSIAERALAGRGRAAAARPDGARLEWTRPGSTRPESAALRRHAGPPAGYDPWSRAEMLTLLTGERSCVLRLNPTPDRGARAGEFLAVLLDERCPVIVETRPSAERGAGPHGLYGSQVYEVVAACDGRLWLRDPRGADHPEPVTTRELLVAILPWVTTLAPDTSAALSAALAARLPSTVPGEDERRA